LTEQQQWVTQAEAVTREFEAQYPQCGNVLVGRGVLPSSGQDAPVPFLSADCSRMPKADELKRLNQWLKVRTGKPDVRLLLAVSRGRVGRPARVTPVAADKAGQRARL
jgi:hypothetical protein